MTTGSLMKVKVLQNAPLWSILQYFLPALSDNLSLKTFFGLFESGTGFTVSDKTTQYRMAGNFACSFFCLLILSKMNFL